MQESKYFYNGIPLSKYCKDNDINISTIRSRIWKKKQSKKYENYTEQEIVDMVIEAYGSAIKYMYKGIALRQYCLDNGINIGTINSRINNLRKQEKALISKLDMLYQDKFNGIVSEEMYLRISRETENSLIKTREKIQNLQDTKEEKKVNKSEIKDYEDKIRKLIDIDNSSRELIQALIDKIIIDKDRNIEIIYKFSILNN